MTTGLCLSNPIHLRAPVSCFGQGTIKARLLAMKYTTPETFAADVRLVFKNAISFNPESHFVHTWALHLLNEFDVSFTFVQVIIPQFRLVCA